MSDNIEVNQRAGVGSDVTQIGTQIVYKGMTPEEACNLATKLFIDNFPKLQAQAVEIVRARIDEFIKEVAEKLKEKGITDMSAFADPDVQYALYEAQKSYARFGTKEMLSILSSLIANRVKSNDESICLKVALDRAIEIAGFLTTKHLDYLALLFSISQVKFGNVKDVESLKENLAYLDSVFPNVDISSFCYLNMLGCLQLYLLDVRKLLSNRYGISQDQVTSICPNNISQLDGDYTTSHIGTILAITHLEAKTNFKFNPNIWIHL